MLRLGARRLVVGVGAAAAVSAFSVAPPLNGAHCLKLDLDAGTVRSLTASLKGSLADKPALVEHWEGRQGEHQWLEDVLGERALEWVRSGNSKALETLGGDPTGSGLYQRLFGILTNKEKIPFLRKIGGWYYNFWTDEENPRGLWRRTDLDSYRAGQPAWEVVLSIDALNREEGESWVYKGHTLFKPPDGTAPTRTLLQLSRGGADAVVLREFDLVHRRFVPESEGGFVVAEAKTRAAWVDADTLLVGTRFADSPDDSLTSSGYPRTVREWRRGTALVDAPEVFAGRREDVSIGGYVSRHRDVVFEWRYRSPTFFTTEVFVRRRGADGAPGPWHRLMVPEDSRVGQFGEHFLISLKSDWEGYKAGSLLAAPADCLLTERAAALASAAPHPTPAAVSDEDRTAPPLPAGLSVLFQPEERVALERGGYTLTRNKLVLSVLDNVRSQLRFLSLAPDGKTWVRDVSSEEAPQIEGVAVSAVDADADDAVWLTSWSYLRPTTLSLADARGGVSAMRATAQPLRSLPPQFDSSTHEVTQGSATSKDGTVVPYFVLQPKERGAPTPTLLYGYGGFQISMLPKYVATTGAAWLEKGGCYVEANIRGGGEFGPEWHTCAKRERRNVAYEDFEAVAEDLILKGVTTSPMLACRGGSNGGLLVGNMLVRRPELWGAVVCAVPLLDMKRFSHLLAGASWTAEYGDPDTSDWDDFLWRYSAYHHIDPGAKAYPPLLMTTSTRDDRVHPYHARAFVRRLQESGHGATTTYYENIEGGHGGAADPKQQAFMLCLLYEFLHRTVGATLSEEPRA